MEGSLLLLAVFVVTWLIATWIIGLVFMLAEIRDIPRNEWWIGALGWFCTSFFTAPLLLFSAVTQEWSQRLRWRTPDGPPRTASAIPASPADDPPAEVDPAEVARLEEAIRETLDITDELADFGRHLAGMGDIPSMSAIPSGTSAEPCSVDTIQQALDSIREGGVFTSVSTGRVTGRQPPSDPPPQATTGRRVRIHQAGDFTIGNVDWAATEWRIRDNIAMDVQAAPDQLEEYDRQLEEMLMSQLDSGDSRAFAAATHALGQLSARRRERREAAVRERTELRPTTTSVPELQTIVAELRRRVRVHYREQDRLRARIRDLEEMLQEQQVVKPGAASRQHRRIRIRQPEEES